MSMGDKVEEIVHRRKNIKFEDQSKKGAISTVQRTSRIIEACSHHR
jgi:hypothetical protein